jgi:hypothetical protein
MNSSLFKNIRSYAELRGLDYKTCKKLYLSGGPKLRAIYRKEMDMARETKLVKSA